MRVLRQISGGLFAAFLCLYAMATHAAPDVDALVRQARQLRLAEQPVWQALLHANNQVAQIRDPAFLLGGDADKPEDILERTLYALYRDRAVCRFPARYWWLQKELSAPKLPLSDCPEVADFRRHAPIDEIALVFASENHAQPASVLGHAFLRLAGHDVNDLERTHAVSFYTDADTLNLPKLLAESLITGKRGYFSLTPYPQQLTRYTDDEQRSVWEYTLDLSPWQREFIRLHLLELKHAELTYFFHHYNCATLLRFILVLAGAPLPPTNGWVTPKSLVQDANAAGLITRRRMISPSRWLAAQLGEQLSPAVRAETRRSLTTGQFSDAMTTGDDAGYLRLEHAAALNQYLYLNKELPRQRWLDNDANLAELRKQHYSDKSLSLSDSASPLSAAPDTQIDLGWRLHDNAAILLTLMPASHTLADDNRGYRSENGLQLLTPRLALPLDGGTPRLDAMTLYAMQSLLPWQRDTGGISGRFSVAWQPQRDATSTEQHAMTVEGDAGLTLRLHRDLDVYTLAGGGAGSRLKGDGYLYAQVEGGVILRGIADTKTLLSVGRHYNQLGSGSAYTRYRVQQMHYVNRRTSAYLSWQQERLHETRRDELTIGIKRLF